MPMRPFDYAFSRSVHTLCAPVDCVNPSSWSEGAFVQVMGKHGGGSAAAVTIKEKRRNI